MEESEVKIAWPHAPTHRLEANGTYFVTGRTYDAAHHFRGRHRVQVLHRGLLKVAQKYGWRLEAWAVFSNHYHFIGHCPSTAANAESLADMLKLLHCQTAMRGGGTVLRVGRKGEGKALASQTHSKTFPQH